MGAILQRASGICALLRSIVEPRHLLPHSRTTLRKPHRCAGLAGPLLMKTGTSTVDAEVGQSLHLGGYRVGGSRMVSDMSPPAA